MWAYVTGVIAQTDRSTYPCDQVGVGVVPPETKRNDREQGNLELADDGLDAATGGCRFWGTGPPITAAVTRLTKHS